VVISQKSGHGFASSKPIVMFDSKTLASLKTIEVEGNPDGMLYDASSDRVYVFSHREPHVTAINAADGSIIGTVNIDGAPEQAQSDGAGHLYVDVEDKENVAVVDTKALKVTAHYDLKGKGGVCAGLAMDVQNKVLFASCRNPQNMVALSAPDGNILATLPIGAGTDGAVFNPATKEIFSSNGDGTLSIFKENSPSSFAAAQTLNTMVSAKTMALDEKTGHLYLIAAEFGAPPAGGRGRGAMVPDSFSIIVVGK
jgi:DNA-binding beta-propeller fold protein YncE